MSIRRASCHTHTQIALKPYMFKLFPIVSVLRSSCGSLFQIVGPHTRKMQQPNRVDRARGTTMSPWSADRSRERAATVCERVYITKVLHVSK